MWAKAERGDAPFTRLLLGALALAALTLLAAMTTRPAGAQTGDVTFEAVFGDVSLDDVDDSDPLRVDSNEIIDLELTVTNGTDETVEVGQIRIESKLLSFTFLTQALRTDVTVGPGESETVELPVDFVGVEGQASGYFRAEMRLLDPDGSTLAGRDFTLDIRGDAFAAANTVFYILIAFAAVVVVRNVLAIVRRRLDVNRLVRAFRLGIVGLQVGVVLVIASSLFRIRAMDGSQWIPLVAIATLIGFVVGYFLTLAPKGLEEDEDDGDPEADRDTVALDAERDQATRALDPEAQRPTIDENRATGARETIAPTGPRGTTPHPRRRRNRNHRPHRPRGTTPHPRRRRNRNHRPHRPRGTTPHPRRRRNRNHRPHRTRHGRRNSGLSGHGCRPGSRRAVDRCTTPHARAGCDGHGDRL